jgi:predicted phage tail component-like protein
MEFFTFNGKDSRDFKIKVLNVKRPLLPEIKDHYEEIPGRHGAYLYPRPYGDRVIKIDCAVKAATVQERTELAQKIAAWLHTPTRQILTFEDEPNVFYLAKVNEQPDPDMIALIGSFTFSFRCDPFKYARDTREEIIDPAESNKAYSIYNNGTIEATPTIVLEAIYGEVTNPKIVINDQTLIYNGTLTNNSAIELNTEYFLANKSMERDIMTTGAYDTAEDNILAMIDGDFGLFNVGANTIVFISDNGQPVRLKILWKEKYL